MLRVRANPRQSQRRHWCGLARKRVRCNYNYYCDKLYLYDIRRYFVEHLLVFSYEFCGEDADDGRHRPYSREYTLCFHNRNYSNPFFPNFWGSGCHGGGDFQRRVLGLGV